MGDLIDLRGKRLPPAPAAPTPDATPAQLGDGAGPHRARRLARPRIVKRDQNRLERFATLAATENGASLPTVAFLASLHGSPLTRATMLHSLDFLAGQLLKGSRAELVEWHRLKRPHVDALVSKLVDQKYASATINRSLSALRGVVRAAWGLGLVSHEDCERICAVRGPKNNQPLAGRVLSLIEIRKLYDAAMNNDAITAARDAALLTTAYCCGMRREESAALPLGGFRFASSPALAAARRCFTFLGKGAKYRTVHLAVTARAHIENWLELRGERGGDAKDLEGPLLTRLSVNGRCVGPLTGSGVYHILEQLARRAGVNEFSPHDLRRTFITTLLDAGVDVLTVARLAGHSDPKTTMRYDRRGDKALAEAADTLDGIVLDEGLPVIPPPT